MRIAIIGGGISGMVSAYLLNKDHDIVLFEANNYIGGHTHTIDVTLGERRYAVDTGFIVFNEVTYPNFLKLLGQLGVEYQPSSMTFSVKSERDGIEYSTRNLNNLFAQRKNLLDPSFYQMIRDIFRFRRKFDSLLEGEQQEQSLVPFLLSQGYSRRFIDYFIIPLGASLWSADPKLINDFPLATFVRFFENHGFLQIKNPFEWKVIKGGSTRYVDKLIDPFRDKIRLDTPVRTVTRHPDKAEIQLDDGTIEQFDHLVLAVHSDQALEMLSDPTPVEREILGAIPYQENLTMLHTDTSILPDRQRIWSSWNYCIPREQLNRAVITYDMNILQSLQAPEEFCVTLNRPDVIDKDRIIGTYYYHHPIYTSVAPAVQKRHREISGVNRTHYAGAYWGYGFHEDGCERRPGGMRLLWKETVKSCIYTGHVRHIRYQPVENHFRYSLFMMYLDLGELNILFQARTLWSVERPNLAWFRRCDYLGDPSLPLETAVRELVQERLGQRPEGPIRVLTHLRYFGHIFNPVSIYYCFDQSGNHVQAIVADITNTPWGERYSYVLGEKQNVSTGKGWRFRFAKTFHVSPFMDMDMEYDWRFSEPDKVLRVQMISAQKETKMFVASLDLERRQLNGSNLTKMLLSYPPMTLKTVAAIYWQALRLRIKGATFYEHPAKREKC